MITHRLEPCKCPGCGVPLDATTDPSDQNATPEPGDVTLCFYCETLLEFDEQLELREIDIKTLQPEVQDLVVARLAQMQAVKEQRTFH